MIAITLDNFQQMVVEESKVKLVLVTFWADQVPESLELRDKLAGRLAGYSEYITLASIDCQTQGQIAQQFGIQGLPTAVLLKDAQPVDGLTGPQDDAAIDVFIDKNLPKKQDILLAHAKEALTENKLTDAQSSITQAYQLDNERADIKLVLTDIYVQTGKVQEAKSLLETILMVDQDSDYQALVAKVELAEQAANSPEIQALEEQLKSAPADSNLNLQLAAQYSQVNRQEEALTILFRLIQAGDDATKAKSKELYIDILKALPDGDAIAATFRRKLYTLMY